MTTLRVGEWWDRFWFAPIPLTRLGIWRVLVCAVALYDLLLYSGTVLKDAAAVAGGSELRSWNPIYLFDVLRLEPIGTDAALWVQAVGVIALSCGILGIWPRTSCLVGGIVLVYWTGLAYSFGKPHHDKIALTFALLLLPLAPCGARISWHAVRSAWRRARRGEPELPEDASGPAFPLRVAQITIALGYCAAGASKLMLGGFEWFNGYSLQGSLLGHDNDAARFVAGSVLLCRLQSVGLVSTQVLFPLVLVLPVARWFFLPMAITFHLITWATMDTGPYMRLWILLAVFLPLERVPAIVRGWLQGRWWQAVPAALVAVGLPALVIWIVSIVVPGWALWVGFGSLAVAAVLYVMPSARLTFLFDGRCRICRGTVAVLRGLDWGARIRFVDLHDAAARRSAAPSVDLDAALRDVHAIDARGRVLVGFDAYRAVAWRSPLTLLLAPLLHVPPVAAVARRVYRQVADRRMRLGCSLHGAGPAGG